MRILDVLFENGMDIVICWLVFSKPVVRGVPMKMDQRTRGILKDQ